MKWVLLSLLLFSLLLVGCTTLPTTEQNQVDVPAENPPIDWKEAELTSIVTGENFKISDFAGKPVLVESFAVWCPVCLRQQEEINELQEQVGDAVVFVSLDTDPNEDATKIQEYLVKQNYEFDWYFAVAPVEVTQSLIKDFGLMVVNAPSAPVILVCPDQSTRFLDAGVKKVGELEEEITKGC